MNIGTLGEAILRAIGAVADRPAEIRLRGIADDALKRHDGNLKRAAEAVERAVRDDPELLLQMLDEARFVGGICNRYVERRAHALRTTTVSLPGQKGCDTQLDVARQGAEQDAPKGAGAGHIGRDTQPELARPTEHRDAPPGAGGGQKRHDTQKAVAPATETPAGQDTVDIHPPIARGATDTSGNAASETPAGQARRDAQNTPARRHPTDGGADTQPAPKGTAPRHRPGNAKRSGFKAMQRVRDAASRSVLDLIRVNGQPLRDVTAGEALAWAEKQATDAATVQRVCTGLTETKVIGEQLSDAEAEARAKLT